MAEGITLRSSAVVIKGLPWLSLAYNTISPLLVLGEEGIEFRVLRRRLESFEAIEELDLQRTFFGYRVVFTFRDRRLCFAGYLSGGESALRRAFGLIAALEGRIRFSQRAVDVVKAGPAKRSRVG